jgi:hypothetical protein
MTTTAPASRAARPSLSVAGLGMSTEFLPSLSHAPFARGEERSASPFPQTEPLT